MLMTTKLAFGGTEEVKFTAKAGENIIETHTPLSAVSYMAVTTKAPAWLTIAGRSGADRCQTKKHPDFDCFMIQKSGSTTAWGAGTTGTITSVVFDEDTEVVFEYRG